MGRIRFNKSFSNIFNRIGRRFIGLYEEGQFGALLGLRIKIVVVFP
jgi:hypothetical protein